MMGWNSFLLIRYAYTRLRIVVLGLGTGTFYPSKGSEGTGICMYVECDGGYFIPTLNYLTLVAGFLPGVGICGGTKRHVSRINRILTYKSSKKSCSANWFPQYVTKKTSKALDPSMVRNVLVNEQSCVFSTSRERSTKIRQLSRCTDCEITVSPIVIIHRSAHPITVVMKTKSQTNDRRTKVDASIKSRRTTPHRPSPVSTMVPTCTSNATTTSTSSSIHNDASTTSTVNDNGIPPTLLLPTSTVVSSSSHQPAATNLDVEKHEARRIARRVKTSLSSQEEGRAVGDSIGNLGDQDTMDLNHLTPGAFSVPVATSSTAESSSSFSHQPPTNLDAEKHEARRVARRVKTSLSSQEEGRVVGDSISHPDGHDMMDMDLSFTPGAYSVPGTTLLEQQEAPPNDEMENVINKADAERALNDPILYRDESVSLVVAAEVVNLVEEPTKDMSDEEWKLKIEQEVASRLVQRDQSLTVAEVVPHPTNPTTKGSTDQAQCMQCCWKWKFLLLFVFLAMGGGMAGIIIWATSGSIEADSPTLAPTPSPTLDERQQQIMHILQQQYNDDLNLTNIQDNDPNSPQLLALEWLLYNDTNSALRNLSDNSTTMVPPLTTMILERYGLAILFFSTNGPLWKNRLAFLTESHVCDWNDETESSPLMNVPNVSDTYGVYCNSSSSSSAQDQVVQQIRLSTNDLVGTLPSELRFLSHLQVLSLDNNTLEDDIPTELGQLTALQELTLHTNTLDGTLPTELGQLTAMTKLELHTNNLMGILPAEWGNMTLLERLDIHDNRFTGTLPTEIGQWTMLERMDLYRNYLGGTLPTEMGYLQALTMLRAQSNVFIGTLPTELGQLTDLEQLYIYDNSLTGTVPPELYNFTTAQIIFEPQNLDVMGGGVGFVGTWVPTSAPTTTSAPTPPTASSAAAAASWCVLHVLPGMSSVLLVPAVLALVPLFW